MPSESKFPIWEEKYEKMGVTPHELYLRQQGICFIRPEIDMDGKVTLHCTDNKDKAITSGMLNPTFECIQCLTRFTENVIEEQLEGRRPKIGEDDTGSNP